MNRKEFMDQLEKLLSDISREERQEALDYYESYFDEAGADREAEVIQELGSPGKVAAIIKADLRESSGNSDSYGTYTEQGFHRGGAEETLNTPGTSESSRAERGYHPKPKRGSGPFILILILVVFLSPFLIGSVGGVLGFLVALVLLPFLVVFGIGAMVVGLFIAGVCVLAAGISACLATPAVGILTIGIGCILMALALVGLVFAVWLGTKALPALLKGFTDLCHRLINRKNKGGNEV